MARSAACRTIRLPTPVAGRTPSPGFAGDDARPTLAAALAAYASDPRAEVFLALQGARLLVPVLACPATSRSTPGHVGPAEKNPVTWPPCLSHGPRRPSGDAGLRRRRDAGGVADKTAPVPVAAPLVARSALDKAAVGRPRRAHDVRRAGRRCSRAWPANGFSLTRAGTRLRRGGQRRRGFGMGARARELLLLSPTDRTGRGSDPTSGGSAPPRIDHTRSSGPVRTVRCDVFRAHSRCTSSLRVSRGGSRRMRAGPLGVTQPHDNMDARRHRATHQRPDPGTFSRSGSWDRRRHRPHGRCPRVPGPRSRPRPRRDRPDGQAPGPKRLVDYGKFKYKKAEGP